MTTKEMFELSDKICDKLSDYRQEMKNAIITCMNERGVNEIDPARCVRTTRKMVCLK